MLANKSLERTIEHRGRKNSRILRRKRHNGAVIAATLLQGHRPAAELVTSPSGHLQRSARADDEERSKASSDRAIASGRRS